MDGRMLRGAVRAAGIDVEPVLFDVVDSTNTALLRMAAEEAPAWTVVAAREQTGGRGRLGRSWFSPRDSSLALSVLLRPDVDATAARLLPLAAGVAMATACAMASGLDVRCKWPNDLVVSERKLGGMLSEAVIGTGRPVTVVIGAGVNLNMRRDDFGEELRETATSLAAEGAAPDPSAIVTRYLSALRTLVEPPAPASEILARYRPLCATLGRRVVASMPDGSSVRGDAVDVDETGALVVRTPSGVERVGFGEVQHLR